jgi:guanylate kinase
MKGGKLIVVTAPSGSGKTTLVHHLLEQPELNLSFSVSATSRKKRTNETEGKDYYFLSVEDFMDKVKNQEFLEYEQVYPHVFYGTLKGEVQRLWAAGKHVIFDVDVWGGLTIKKQFPGRTLALFVQPPDLKALEERLRGRKTETEAEITMRLAKATQELALAPKFDAIIVNSRLENAKAEAYKVVHRFING